MSLFKFKEDEQNIVGVDIDDIISEIDDYKDDNNIIVIDVSGINSEVRISLIIKYLMQEMTDVQQEKVWVLLWDNGPVMLRHLTFMSSTEPYLAGGTSFKNLIPFIRARYGSYNDFGHPTLQAKITLFTGLPLAKDTAEDFESLFNDVSNINDHIDMRIIYDGDDDFYSGDIIKNDVLDNFKRIFNPAKLNQMLIR